MIYNFFCVAVLFAVNNYHGVVFYLNCEMRWLFGDIFNDLIFCVICIQTELYT